MRHWEDVLPPDVAQAQAGYDRFQSVKRMRELGWTFEKIAAYLGVSMSRANQLYRGGEFKHRSAPILKYFEQPSFVRETLRKRFGKKRARGYGL